MLLGYTRSWFDQLEAIVLFLDIVHVKQIAPFWSNALAIKCQQRRVFQCIKCSKVLMPKAHPSRSVLPLDFNGLIPTISEELVRIGMSINLDYKKKMFWENFIQVYFHLRKVLLHFFPDGLNRAAPVQTKYFPDLFLYWESMFKRTLGINRLTKLFCQLFLTHSPCQEWVSRYSGIIFLIFLPNHLIQKTLKNTCNIWLFERN